MNHNYHMLLGLLRRALFGQSFCCDPKQVDWAALYSEVRAHTVHLLLFDVLTEQERAAMPPEVATHWRVDALRTLQKNLSLVSEQEGLLAALSGANIPCAVFKGSTCGANYPRPELRCAGDMDFLVNKTDLERARSVLERRAYTARKEHCPWHLSMQRETWLAELHFALAGIPAGPVGEKLRRYFESLPLLDTCQQAVALLLHKLNHLRRDGLGLRHLCDWALFVSKQVDEQVWHELEPQLQKFGLLQFARVVTRLCVDYLGLPQQVAPWCMEADPALAETLLLDILQTGNFGCKEDRYGQHLFTDGGKGGRLRSLWRSGIHACKVHWPACGKYLFLLPVAPCVLAVRRLRQRKASRVPPLRLWTSFRGAKSRQELYRALKPFQTEGTL